MFIERIRLISPDNQEVIKNTIIGMQFMDSVRPTVMALIDGELRIRVSKKFKTNFDEPSRSVIVISEAE